MLNRAVTYGRTDKKPFDNNMNLADATINRDLEKEGNITKTEICNLGMEALQDSLETIDTVF